MQAPFSYSDINYAVSGVSPNTLHTRNNALFAYFRKYLAQKVISQFVFDIPKQWDKTYFEYALILNGFVAVVNTDKYGVIVQACSLRGLNLYYMPTHAIITNPLLSGILEPRIGVQCELIKLSPSFCGIIDIVNKYADLLALTMESLEMNIANSKFSYTFGVKNKAAAETVKKIFDNVQKGEIATFYDSNMKNIEESKLFLNNLKNNFIAQDILDVMTVIEKMFCEEVGIQTVRNEKKERMITGEIERDTISTACKLDLWLETLQESMGRVNEMFGLNLGVKLRYGENNNSGDVQS